MAPIPPLSLPNTEPTAIPSRLAGSESNATELSPPGSGQ